MITDFVHYPGGDGDHHAYVARPKVGYASPGIVLLHDRWGLTEATTELARRLAADGYVTMAPDLYHGAMPEEEEEARRLAYALAEGKGIDDVRTALYWMRNQGYVTAHLVAAVGLCAGGKLALLAASETVNAPQAVVAFYGAIAPALQRGDTFTVPVQGHFGGEDALIPADDVHALEQALTRDQVPHEIHLYPGVGHDFIRPGSPTYDQAAAEEAWGRMLTFLARHLKPGGM